LAKQANFFDETQEDLPLFSGTAQRAKQKVFDAQPVQTERLPGFDDPPDWQEMCANRGRIIRPKRRPKCKS
jgi:hypothetical protein